MTIMNLFRDTLTVINSLNIPVGNLGVSRRQMPQIDEDQIERFKNALEESGLSYANDREYVNKLKLTQSEVNKTKVWHIMKNMRRSGTRKGQIPKIFVSSDNFVLDGSHRLVAALNINRRQKMSIVRINVPALSLLQIFKADPTKFGIRYRSYSDSE